MLSVDMLLLLLLAGPLTSIGTDVSSDDGEMAVAMVASTLPGVNNIDSAIAATSSISTGRDFVTSFV